MGAHAVVGEDVVGGGKQFLALEDEALAAALVRLHDDELVAVVAQHLDEVGEILDGDAVDRFYHGGHRVGVALRDLVREEGRADGHEFLPGERRLVAEAQHQRTGDVAVHERHVDLAAGGAGDKRRGGPREDHRSKDEIRRIVAAQLGEQLPALCHHRQFDRKLLAGAYHCERHLAVARRLLDEIGETYPQIGADADHAVLVDRGAADARDHIPLAQRVVGGVVGGMVHDHALHGRTELEERAQRRVLQSLEIVEEAGFAVVGAVGDVLKEQFDLLAGDDVADVFGPTEVAER